MNKNIPNIYPWSRGDVVSALKDHIATNSGTPSDELVDALVQASARMVELATDRLNQVSQKVYLQHIDTAGSDFIPAASALTPVKFHVSNNIRDLQKETIPAGFQVASIDNDGNELIFETQEPLTLQKPNLDSVKYVDYYRNKTSNFSDFINSGNITQLPELLLSKTESMATELFIEHPQFELIGGENNMYNLSLRLTFDSEISNITLKNKTFDQSFDICISYRNEKEVVTLNLSKEINYTYSKNSIEIHNLEIKNPIKRSTITSIKAVNNEEFTHSGYFISLSIAPKLNQLTSHITESNELKLTVSKLEYKLENTHKGTNIPKAYFNQQELDLSQTFLPFGETPQANDCFYFTSPEFGNAGERCDIKTWIMGDLGGSKYVHENNPNLLPIWSKKATTPRAFDIIRNASINENVRCEIINSSNASFTFIVEVNNTILEENTLYIDSNGHVLDSDGIYTSDYITFLNVAPNITPKELTCTLSSSWEIERVEAVDQVREGKAFDISYESSSVSLSTHFSVTISNSSNKNFNISVNRTIDDPHYPTPIHTNRNYTVFIDHDGVIKKYSAPSNILTSQDLLGLVVKNITPGAIPINTSKSIDFTTDNEFTQSGSTYLPEFHLEAYFKSLHLVYEYYNGVEWTTLDNLNLNFDESDKTNRHATFQRSSVNNTLRLNIPDDVQQCDVNGDRDWWLRARIISGGYGDSGKLRNVQPEPLLQTIPLEYNSDGTPNVNGGSIKVYTQSPTAFEEESFRAPQVKEFRIETLNDGYKVLGGKAYFKYYSVGWGQYGASIKNSYSQGEVYLKTSEGFFDLPQSKETAQQIIGETGPFRPPFTASHILPFELNKFPDHQTEKFPALYFGFEGDTLAGTVNSLFLSLEENPLFHRKDVQRNDFLEPADFGKDPDEVSHIRASLSWQYYESKGWQELTVEDRTLGFSQSENITFRFPEDALPFELLRDKKTWIRAVINDPELTTLNAVKLKGIYQNTILAQNRVTVRNECLGSSDGFPSQVFTLNNTPVINTPRIMIREVDVISDRELTDMYHDYHGTTPTADVLEAFRKSQIMVCDVNFITNSKLTDLYKIHYGTIPTADELKVFRHSHIMVRVSDLISNSKLTDLYHDYHGTTPTADELEAFRKSMTEVQLDENGTRTAIFVEWIQVNDFNNSKPLSRHYTFDHTTGTVTFGDGVNGMIPDAGGKNIFAAEYSYGGGTKGNIAVNSIDQMRNRAQIVTSVTNIDSGFGGGDVESVAELMKRGSSELVNFGRAVTPEDYEICAKLSSSNVARATASSSHFPDGSVRTGNITVAILTNDIGDKPMPSAQMRRKVKEYLLEKAPTQIKQEVIDIQESRKRLPEELKRASFYSQYKDRLEVVPPNYIQAGMNAEIYLADYTKAEEIKTVILKKAKEFFHPLKGGLEGRGWEFGRTITTSSVEQFLLKQREIVGVKNISFKTAQIFLTLKLALEHADLYASENVTEGCFIDLFSSYSERVTLQVAESVTLTAEPRSVQVVGFSEGDVVELTYDNNGSCQVAASGRVVGITKEYIDAAGSFSSDTNPDNQQPVFYLETENLTIDAVRKIVGEPLYDSMDQVTKRAPIRYEQIGALSNLRIRTVKTYVGNDDTAQVHGIQAVVEELVTDKKTYTTDEFDQIGTDSINRIRISFPAFTNTRTELHPELYQGERDITLRTEAVDPVTDKLYLTDWDLPYAGECSISVVSKSQKVEG